jgi:hypothetical protein
MRLLAKEKLTVSANVKNVKNVKKMFIDMF